MSGTINKLITRASFGATRSWRERYPARQ